jgi:hypothetical protein
MKIRPVKWSPNIDDTVDEYQYNMVNIHKFITECLNLKHCDGIVCKNNLFNKFGLYGIIEYIDGDMIMLIDNSQPLEQKYISIFHECFHLFFRDYESNSEDNDDVEKRAEMSSLNTLSWYHKNQKSFTKITKKILQLPIEELNKLEKDCLKDTL